MREEALEKILKTGHVPEEVVKFEEASEELLNSTPFGLYCSVSVFDSSGEKLCHVMNTTTHDGETMCSIHSGQTIRTAIERLGDKAKEAKYILKKYLSGIGIPTVDSATIYEL